MSLETVEGILSCSTQPAFDGLLLTAVHSTDEQHHARMRHKEKTKSCKLQLLYCLPLYRLVIIEDLQAPAVEKKVSMAEHLRVHLTYGSVYSS